MNITAIIDTMEKKANEIYEANQDYHREGKRGCMVAEIKSDTVAGQWESISRLFGALSAGPGLEDGMTISPGANFEGIARAKIAYILRTGKNSGSNFWEVYTGEVCWTGAVCSRDGKCICGFSGLKGHHDQEISRAGIDEYERQK